MVYPFDIKTGAELSDRAITSNGFKLDMAKSRYLTIDVTRTVLNVGADGQLTEDVRFMHPAKDNDTYTDEGIYTFTVKNLYSGDENPKTIYVGTDKYLLALSKNSLTVDALNEKIEQGSEISDDGTISDYVPPVEPESPVPEEQNPQPIVVIDTPTDEVSTNNPDIDVSEPVPDETPQISFSILPIVVALAVVSGGVFAAVAIMKKAKKKKKGADI